MKLKQIITAISLSGALISCQKDFRGPWHGPKKKREIIRKNEGQPEKLKINLPDHEMQTELRKYLEMPQSTDLHQPEQILGDRISVESLVKKYGDLESAFHGKKWFREGSSKKTLYQKTDTVLSAVEHGFQSINPEDKSRFLPNETSKVETLGSGSYGTVYSVEIKSPDNKLHTVAIKESKIPYDYLYQAALRQVETSDIFSGENSHSLYYGSFIKKNLDGNLSLYSIYRKQAGDLSNYKPSNERIPRYDILATLKGLHSMHDKGLAHWDIKPANMLQSDQTKISPENILIGDLGSASPTHRFKLEDFDGYTALFLSPNFLAAHAKIQNIWEDVGQEMWQAYEERFKRQNQSGSFEFVKELERDSGKLAASILAKFNNEDRLPNELTTFLEENHIHLDTKRNDIYALGLSLAFTVLKPSDIGSTQPDMLHAAWEHMHKSDVLVDWSFTEKIQKALRTRGKRSDLAIASMLNKNPPKLPELIKTLEAHDWDKHPRSKFYTK